MRAAAINTAGGPAGRESMGAGERDDSSSSRDEHSVDGEPWCPVCLVSEDTGWGVILGCGHLLCRDCLERIEWEWHSDDRKHRRCPICRSCLWGGFAYRVEGRADRWVHITEEAEVVAYQGKPRLTAWCYGGVGCRRHRPPRLRRVLLDRYRRWRRRPAGGPGFATDLRRALQGAQWQWRQLFFG